jgi:hypothetical protein
MTDASLCEFAAQLALSRELLRELRAKLSCDDEPLLSSRAAIASSLELLRRLEAEARVAAMYGGPQPRSPWS